MALEWRRLEHRGRRLNQWVAELDEGGIAHIQRVGPYMGYGRNDPMFSLAFPGRDLKFYDSLDDAIRAAEDPESVEPLSMRNT